MPECDPCKDKKVPPFPDYNMDVEPIRNLPPGVDAVTGAAPLPPPPVTPPGGEWFTFPAE